MIFSPQIFNVLAILKGFESRKNPEYSSWSDKQLKPCIDSSDLMIGFDKSQAGGKALVGWGMSLSSLNPATKALLI